MNEKIMRRLQRCTFCNSKDIHIHPPDDLGVMLRREIDKFAAQYHRYFKEHAGLDGRDRQRPRPQTLQSTGHTRGGCIQPLINHIIGMTSVIETGWPIILLPQLVNNDKRQRDPQRHRTRKTTDRLAKLSPDCP